MSHGQAQGLRSNFYSNSATNGPALIGEFK